jgi:hypothetical protein
MSRVDPALSRNAALAAGALLASSATLVCCVLPVVFVTLGAGAALAAVVSAVPQLIWLSEHKTLVFGGALALLAVSGVALWYGRSLPCPTDPDAAQACRRLRRISAILYSFALASFLLGFLFAFLLPALPH